MSDLDAKIDLLLDELRQNPEKAAELCRAAHASGVTVSDAAEGLRRGMAASGLTLAEASDWLQGLGDAFERAEREDRERQAAECVARLLSLTPRMVVPLGRAADLLAQSAIREANAYLRKHGFDEFEAVEGRHGELVVQRKISP